MLIGSASEYSEYTPNPQISEMTWDAKYHHIEQHNC